MTHVIEVEVRRFYKVYVEDEVCEMTEEEAEAKAREMVEDDTECLCEVDELKEIEPDDCMSYHYSYNFD